MLTIRSIEVVDIGISEGTTSDSITADTNASGIVQRMWGDKTLHSETHLATGPIMLKISNNIASVTVGSSSPT